MVEKLDDEAFVGCTEIVQSLYTYKRKNNIDIE